MTRTNGEPHGRSADPSSPAGAVPDEAASPALTMPAETVVVPLDPRDLDALRYVLNFASEPKQIRTVMSAFTLPERETTAYRLERLYTALKTAAPAVATDGDREVAARAVYAARPARYLHPEERNLTWDEAAEECPDRVAKIYSDVDAILAALSRPAPVAVLVKDRFGTILEHLSEAPEGWEIRRATPTPEPAGNVDGGYDVFEHALKAVKVLQTMLNAAKLERGRAVADDLIADLEAALRARSSEPQT